MIQVICKGCKVVLDINEACLCPSCHKYLLTALDKYDGIPTSKLPKNAKKKK